MMNPPVGGDGADLRWSCADRYLGAGDAAVAEVVRGEARLPLYGMPNS